MAMCESQQKFKSVALLYLLLKGQSFTFAGEKIRLGGDLLVDLGMIDKEHPDHLVMLKLEFRDFFKLARSMNDSDFRVLLKEMSEEFSKS